MSTEAQYPAIVLAMGNNTGIEIPPQVIADLGAGQRPAVCVTVGEYSWSVTAGVMAGKHLISLSKAHRDASDLAAGDRVQAHLRVLSAPREVLVSDASAAALHQANLRQTSEALNYSTRKEHAKTVSEAKAEATRDRRIWKILEVLTGAHPADSPRRSSGQSAQDPAVNPRLPGEAQHRRQLLPRWQETNGAAQDSAAALTDNSYRATALLVEPSETVNTGDTPGHPTAERHVITVK